MAIASPGPDLSKMRPSDRPTLATSAKVGLLNVWDASTT